MRSGSGALSTRGTNLPSQHRCHWLSRCLCKHFTIWRMTKNLVKIIIGNVASSYQVNLSTEIPNITENYINSHAFTCHHWVSSMLNIRHDVGMFLIGQIFFYSGGLGANWNVSRKLGMNLAIARGSFVVGPCFVIQYFVSFLVLQSSQWGVFLSSMWLLVFCFSSSRRYRWLVCSVWLWHFLVKGRWLAFPGQSSSLTFWPIFGL